VIDDATLDDAARSGIAERFDVISNGSDTPGIWLSECSGAFVRQFEQADLVIAIGQGNYESLGDHPGTVFFLLFSECPVDSEKLGFPSGSCAIRAK
jgi:uncharacterized protein with ATP-grasp and redox domains